MLALPSQIPSSGLPCAFRPTQQNSGPPELFDPRQPGIPTHRLAAPPPCCLQQHWFFPHSLLVWHPPQGSARQVPLQQLPLQQSVPAVHAEPFSVQQGSAWQKPPQQLPLQQSVPAVHAEPFSVQQGSAWQKPPQQLPLQQSVPAVHAEPFSVQQGSAWQKPPQQLPLQQSVPAVHAPVFPTQQLVWQVPSCVVPAGQQVSVLVQQVWVVPVPQTFASGSSWYRRKVVPSQHVSDAGSHVPGRYAATGRADAGGLCSVGAAAQPLAAMGAKGTIRTFRLAASVVAWASAVRVVAAVQQQSSECSLLGRVVARARAGYLAIGIVAERTVTNFGVFGSASRRRWPATALWLRFLPFLPLPPPFLPFFRRPRHRMRRPIP